MKRRGGICELQRRMPKSKAPSVLAQNIGRAVFYMLKTGRVFDDARFINGYMVEGTQYKGEHVSTERRYCVSSRVCDAQSFMEAVPHWQVESLHWILDIGFCEDDCRIRKDHGPENMALFRQIAVNLLKRDKTVKLGIRNRRTIAAADDNYRERLLQGLEKQPTSQMR